MKQNTLIILGMFLLLATCWSCKNETSGVTAVVNVTYHDYGSHYAGMERDVPNITVYASIAGNPMPIVNYVQVANKKYDDSESFQFENNSTTFFHPNSNVWMDSVPDSKLSPVTININTSNGSISGSIALPDTLLTLSTDAPDNIPLNSQITLTWTGGNADYYVVRIDHDWIVGGTDWISELQDTVVRGNSITLGSSFTGFNGEINRIGVYPVNGPMPVKGAKPNMTGDGYGYLFAENRDIQLRNRFVIGAGLDFMYDMPSKRSTSLTEPSVGELLRKRYLTLR